VLINAGRQAEALAVYAELMERHPDYYYAQWCFGWLSSQLGDNATYREQAERALKLAPEDVRSLNSLGMLAAREGDWRTARVFWERAFLATPMCSSCSNVGYALYFDGRYKDAARYFEYALDYCDTTEYSPWGNLASAMYWAAGEREYSLEVYNRAITLALERLEQVPDDLVTASWLADFYAMTGQRHAAMEMATRASRSHDGRVAYRLAGVYELLGDRTQALTHIGHAIRDGQSRYEIMNEPVLVDLIEDPRFKQLLKDDDLAARNE
jgi:tetratricopeptide (TPR) repeat protein